MKVTINRSWHMPDSLTFNIRPIKKLLGRYITDGMVVVDPFANGNKIGTITNDLDTRYNTTYNMDAIDFLNMLDDNIADVALFDPPYSPRQVSEVYKKLGRTVDFKTTQSKYWTDLKRQISRILKPNGIAISCAWNSSGMGKSNGFVLVEILLVSHGGWHNDTIVTVERKVKQDLFTLTKAA